MPYSLGTGIIRNNATITVMINDATHHEMKPRHVGGLWKLASCL